MQSRKNAGQSGKTLAAGVALVGVVAIATLALIFRGGGSGSGAGDGTGPASGQGTGTMNAVPQTQATATIDPQRPLKVTIEESSYVVQGRQLDLAGLTDLVAKVPAGAGPAVLIERSPTSRAKAEEELQETLRTRNVTFAMD